jgi:signal transduction protein with GAF and PtsI domain
VIRASLGNRAKESLVVDFINQTDLDQIGDKASVIEAFFTFAQAEQQREAAELISDEGLNAEAAKRYITNSLKREFATENGTELNAVLPKMSPLNPQFLTKKQTVFQKIAAFVEKFKGVGGQLEALDYQGAPSLHPIGLHFKVKAAKIIQAVELLLRFGSTAVSICKHGVTGSARRGDGWIIYTLFC